jgi:hypothetical protein
LGKKTEALILLMQLTSKLIGFSGSFYESFEFMTNLKKLLNKGIEYLRLKEII